LSRMAGHSPLRAMRRALIAGTSIVEEYLTMSNSSSTFLLRRSHSLNGMNSREILAANIKKLMVADPNLNTQAKLAAKASLAQKTVSNVLNKTGPAPTVSTLEGLAKAFKTAPWRLLHQHLGMTGVSPEEAALHRKLEEAYEALQSIKTQ